MDVVACVQGEVKSGKTSTALTFPKPLFHIDLDIGGFRRAAHRYRAQMQGGEIVSKSYYLPDQALRIGNELRASNRVVGAKKLWYELLTDYTTYLESPIFNTVVIDSFPQLWELCRLALLEEKQERKDREKLLEIEYGEANDRMRRVVYRARNYAKNLILVSYMDDKREKHLNKEGEYEDIVVGRKVAGWKHTEKEIDFVLHCERREEPAKDAAGKTIFKGGVAAKKGVFYGTIMKCGLAEDANGFELQDPCWDAVETVIMAKRGEL